MAMIPERHQPARPLLPTWSAAGWPGHRGHGSRSHLPRKGRRPVGLRILSAALADGQGGWTDTGRTGQQYRTVSGDTLRG